MNHDAIDFINGGPLPPTPTEDSDSDSDLGLPDKPFGMFTTWEYNGEVVVRPWHIRFAGEAILVCRCPSTHEAVKLTEHLRAVRAEKSPMEPATARQVLETFVRAARAKWGKP